MIGHLALVASALFTGAALYVTVAEHPARLPLPERYLLQEWKPSYERGATMQAPLALVGALLAAASWWLEGSAIALIAGLVLLANWPFTLVVIKPVNDQLLATEPEKADAATRDLLVKWGELHAVRTTLGLLATSLLLVALSRS